MLTDVSSGDGADRSARLRFTVACSFNENAISSISRHLSRNGRLAERLVPDWGMTAAVAEHAARPLGHSPAGALIKSFATRKRAGSIAAKLPEDVAVSRLTDPIRIAGARFRTPATPLLGQYAWRTEFDHRASRALRFSGADVLVGMPGACLRTFSAHSSALKVFHAIDAHPRFHNQALRDHFGRRAWGETYPGLLLRRIEHELELADVVLVPSQLVADQMTRYGVAADKLLCIPYGVDLERFAPVPSGRSGLGRGRPRLIYAGQISLRKGVPQLLEAVRGLRVELTLAGQIFDRSIVRNLPENVTLAGVLSAAALATAYNRHDALVLPTLDDACSLVVAEAAASGLRVLTTDANGAAELLPESHIVVPAGDVRALRHAIGSLGVPDDADRAARSREVRDDSSKVRPWIRYAEEVVHALEGAARQLGAGAP